MKIYMVSLFHRATIKNDKNPRNGADGHRRQCARLVATYLQSQSQLLASRKQRGDKTQWILVISTFHELQSHVTANWGINSEI